MDDTSKAYAEQLLWSETDPPQVDPETSSDQVPSTRQKGRGTTTEKALDRWFHEQHKSKRIAVRLDVPNEVLVTNGGPLKMTGNITLIDENGSVTHANHLSLCRCGGSESRPLCDDRHLDIEFLDSGTLRRISDFMPVIRPQSITVTCVKNGPLKFRGYLRIYNRKGQECITMNGALCRCGKSSKKPFCDNANGCGDC